MPAARLFFAETVEGDDLGAAGGLGTARPDAVPSAAPPLVASSAPSPAADRRPRPGGAVAGAGRRGDRKLQPELDARIGEHADRVERDVEPLRGASEAQRHAEALRLDLEPPESCCSTIVISVG